MKDFIIKGICVGQIYIEKNIDINDEKLIDYLTIEQRLPLKKAKSIINLLPSNITLIKHIEIYEKFRSKGFGSKMLDEIISESNSDLLLISETSNDFLLDFYLKKGFEIIGYCYKLPILLFRK